MLAATENSIRSLIYEDRNDIFSSLASTKLVLEQLHESGEGQFSKVEIFDDLMKLIEISEHINATKNLPEKIKLISEEYQTLARQIRIKYSDFLPNRVNRELEAGENMLKGLKTNDCSTVYTTRV